MANKSKSNSEEFVYQKLKTAIRKRYIKQGNQLVEVTIAQQLGVSRTPVRSAIKRLAAEGLVNAIPNRGAFVITPTKREIKETFLVRAQLEMMATELATEKITPEQVDSLRKMLFEEIRFIDKNNFDDYYAANDSIHLRIAELSDNKILYGYIKELLDKTRIYLILYDPFLQIEYSPTAEHAAIIDTMAQGDVKKACHAMKVHIGSSITGLESIVSLPEDYLML
jgi:DNA-binding GntR family transcriptional regulator